MPRPEFYDEHDGDLDYSERDLSIDEAEFNLDFVEYPFDEGEGDDRSTFYQPEDQM